ncbi:MAG: hypothetical protein KatS3mg033_1133 [Thermonema sp.]|uniref:hypothetical protein n=1 Tax=Thermonema sp. TaxID=2231181 RepID=UPI0021DE15AF|nr:hypothetical protein [Thermonema sp.]GIV39333.1 MAG: hypothetical protein KatS3mg033_1133 [Thermonema sp.]
METSRIETHWLEPLKTGGKTWIWHPEFEPEDDGLYAHILFLRRDEEGKEWVCDAVMHTLATLYHYQLHEEAEMRLKALMPAWRGWEAFAELPEAMQAKAQALYDEIVQELIEEGEMKVQESVEVYRDEANCLEEIDVYLNKEAIDVPAIDWFVQAYRRQSVSLDPNFYSFEEEIE